MIYLDDEGKPSATRAVVFVFVILSAVVILADVAHARFEVQDRIYSFLQTVVMTIIAAMATRSTVKYWAPVEEQEEDFEAISPHAHETIGYSMDSFPDEMDWDPDGGTPL